MFTNFKFIKLKKNECYFSLYTVDTVKKYWVAEQINQTIHFFKFSIFNRKSQKKKYIHKIQKKSKELFEANMRVIQVSANRKGVGGKCETINIKHYGFYIRETPPPKKKNYY